MARIRGASRPAARRRTDELIDGLDIGRWATTTGERLSGGVQRLTAFAMAVAQPGRHWMRTFGLLLKWNRLRLCGDLVFFVGIQSLIAIGIVVGFPS